MMPLSVPTATVAGDRCPGREAGVGVADRPSVRAPSPSAGGPEPSMIA